METMLDLKINSATKTVKQIKAVPLTYEEKINKLLDAMNELNGILNDLQEVVILLTYEIERDMSSFKQSTSAHNALSIFIKLVSKILIKVRASDLYPGVKTTYYSIRTENNYLKELIKDRDTGILLDSDTEMQAIIKSTINGKK